MVTVGLLDGGVVRRGGPFHCRQSRVELRERAFRSWAIACGLEDHGAPSFQRPADHEIRVVVTVGLRGPSSWRQSSLRRVE